jgi:hypothetical protein
MFCNIIQLKADPQDCRTKGEKNWPLTHTGKSKKHALPIMAEAMSRKTAPDSLQV